MTNENQTPSAKPGEQSGLAAPTCSAVWNGQLYAHPFHQAIYDLCQEIEMLPASEQETKVVIMAGALQNRVAEMRAEASKQAKRLRKQAAECFPEENGQKHFARLIMEGVADELDAAFSPPNESSSATGGATTNERK